MKGDLMAQDTLVASARGLVSAAEGLMEPLSFDMSTVQTPLCVEIMIIFNQVALAYAHHRCKNCT